jgi:hypothetical protein
MLTGVAGFRSGARSALAEARIESLKTIVQRRDAAGVVNLAGVQAFPRMDQINQGKLYPGLRTPPIV